MDAVGRAVLAVVGLVLVVAAVVLLYPVAVAVLTSWAWSVGFGSALVAFKTVVAGAAGAAGVLAVRASR